MVKFIIKLPALRIFLNDYLTNRLALQMFVFDRLCFHFAYLHAICIVENSMRKIYLCKNLRDYNFKLKKFREKF